MSPAPDGHAGPQPQSQPKASQVPQKQSTSTPTTAQPGLKTPFPFKHPLDPLTATEVRQVSASLSTIELKSGDFTSIDHFDIPRRSHASLGSNPRCARHQFHHLCPCPAAQEGCPRIFGHSLTGRDGREGREAGRARQNGRSRRAYPFF